MQTLKQKHRPFCFSVKGQVKMLRLALTVTSMAFFIIAQAPEPYIVITGFEVAVIFFFIILYMLRLDRLIDCLFWPLLDIINSVVTAIFMIIISVLALIPETTTFIVLGGDLINSFITTVFLLIVAILVMQEMERRHLFYVGGDLLNDLFAIIFLVGAVVIAVKSRQTMPLHYFIAVILIGMAGMFALMDMCLQRKHFKGKRLKTNVLLPPKNERKVEKPKEAENPPEKASEKAPEKAQKPKEKVKRGKK
ncbi:chemokine-like factor isoform X2 [Neofelis nebulosa]|uniref:chemokine-like factor isoform X2 n=1 Tax=Neofelis nebulosa TaxID=61452 RepID=UPI00272A1CD6|nr:chemokine-like factor isoform X2 [Neofelis nebulosa]